MYDGPGLLQMGRMERMREELPSLLASTGQMIGGAMTSYLLEAPAANESQHGESRSAMGDLIVHYGYRSGG